MVAMYHSGTLASIQEVFLAFLNDPNSKVRIIIATAALGMGVPVDMKGLHLIINYGPSEILNRTYKNLEVLEEMANSQKLFLCFMAGSFITVHLR